MEQLLEKLRSCGRYLELKDNIPYWESQIPDLKDRLEEMKWNQQQKETELLSLQEPNFFQRIFGRAEEKKEKSLNARANSYIISIFYARKVIYLLAY